MQVRVLYVALAVLALILGANTLTSHRASGELKAAHDSLTVALRAGDHSRMVADLLRTRAAQAAAHADLAEAAAIELARRARRAEVVYRVAVDSAPAECAPVIEAANAVLAIEQARADSLSGALQSVRSSLTDTRAALDSVRGSYERLRTAAVTLDNAVKPSWREKLVPKLGIGGAVGVDPFTRRPATAFGVTLGWTF